MKFVPSQVDPDAWPSWRGVGYSRDTRWGPIFQQWPRRRGKPRNPYDFYRQKEFGIAARWASSPTWQELATAVYWTAGTSLVPRDMLMAGMYGTAFIVIHPDGTQIEPARHMTNNPQYMLDLITTEPGSMLWRSPIGWIAVEPGIPGQVLTDQLAGPSWQTPLGGGGSTAWTLAQTTVITAPVASVDFGVGAASDVMVIARNLISAGAGARAIRFSVNNGASFYATSGDYITVAATGAESNNTAAAQTTGLVTTVRSLTATMLGLAVDDAPKLISSSGSGDRLFIASLDPVTTIRVFDSAGNLTAGTIYFYAR